MSIFDRLGNIIKSYLNDDDSPASGSSAQYRRTGDPDLDAAYEELDDYLKGGGDSGTWPDESSKRKSSDKPPVPEELRPDFAELGLPFGASRESCKEAYKNLLKRHHPDRHAGHAENMKKATEKSARINAAFDRIEKWRNNL